MSTSTDAVRQHFHAFNTRDADADPWAPEAEMVAPGARVQGREQVLSFLGVFQEAFSDARLEGVVLLADGSRAACEGTFSGTHDGVLHTPDGDVPATGRTVSFNWAAVYDTDGDTITSEHLFFDQMDFLAQLGLLQS